MKSLGRSRWMAGGSGGAAADSFRPAPRGGAAGRGRNEWAGEAKQVGRGALVCSLSEGGRGKDSPPALLERRIQMTAIQEQVGQALRGKFIHSERIAGVTVGKAGQSAWCRASIP
jgi:hypothetical protein